MIGSVAHAEDAEADAVELLHFAAEVSIFGVSGLLRGRVP